MKQQQQHCRGRRKSSWPLPHRHQRQHCRTRHNKLGPVQAPRGSRLATTAPPRRPAGATAAAAAPAAALPDKAQQPDETTGKELKVDDDGVPHDALGVPITTINARTNETTQSRMFTRSMD
ncbi:hypothetical protein PF004_g21903 [Phytophthora fragariae]|uniref:Uncharacterized protein n=1 Tax=Phytophthora fragariae TaxID=53985 RepID=A0A6G0N1V3_9STRA|nr:hypothetical protein PF004_g21903 [Phytophthora fragariae]